MTTSPRFGAASVERECLQAAGLVASGAAAVVVLLWASSFPGWPIAAGIIVSVLVLAAVMLVSGPQPPPAARWLRPAGLVAALLLAVCGGVAVELSGDAATLARFERSQADFDRVATAAGAPDADADGPWGPFPGVCPDQLGSYPIRECRSFDGGYLFVQERAALGSDAGFAYAPSGLPRDNGLPGGNRADGSGAAGFSHLVGPWYAWSCGC